MKFRLLDLLRCSCGKQNLTLQDPKIVRVDFRSLLDKVKCGQFCARKQSSIAQSVISIEDCIDCFRDEIMEGVLACDCGRRYPVAKGIPRFLPEDMRADFQDIQKTFSYEWKMFRFGERNWGQDMAYRKELFLQGMGATHEELKGKVIFDAGCGSGALSMEMAESFGMEVVALDLASGIEKAFEYNKNPFVYFLQGSVLEPPLQNKAFDYVYCAGVLVALPDTRTGFKSIIKMLKPGGRCFIWVYHLINKTYHPNDLLKLTIYNAIRKYITSKLPIALQYYLYLSLMVPFLAKQKIELLTGRKADALTWREKMQALFDMYSPTYQNRHTYDECIEWYKAEGFSNVTVSDKGPYGFGLYGDFNGDVR